MFIWLFALLSTLSGPFGPRYGAPMPMPGFAAPASVGFPADSGTGGPVGGPTIDPPLDLSVHQQAN
jgi:hypothetical protein